jgi:lipopolysaccharide/colanic/teichoic acid biosynthesis glycosyltransferase
MDISQAIRQHISQRAIATVIMQPPPQQVSGRRQDSLPWIDTGIYIFDPLVLDWIPPHQRFEIRKHLLPTLLARGIQLQACPLQGYWNPLDTFQKYSDAQKMFLTNATREKTEPESKVTYRYNSVESRQLFQGIWAEKNVKIHPNAKIVPLVSIGSNTWIGKDAEVGPNVVIGSGVVIDEGATVQNSTILDNTYVGKLIHVQNRLVNQDQLVDIYTNEHVQVTDPVMLGKTNPGFILSGFKRALDFCLALFILLFILPLILSLGFVLMLTTGRVLTRVPCSSPSLLGRKGHLGQTKTFDLLNFNTRKADNRPFRFGAWLESWEGQRLPELVNVIRGDLALVGLKPVVTEAEKRIRDAWHLDEERAQAGFTGQWYLHTDEDSPLEDSFIADVYYLAIRSGIQDWRILRSTPAAWFWKVRSRIDK